MRAFELGDGGTAARGARRAVRRAPRVQLPHPRLAAAGRGLRRHACASRPITTTGATFGEWTVDFRVAARGRGSDGRHRHAACSRTASPTSPGSSPRIEATRPSPPTSLHRTQGDNHAPVHAQLDAVRADRGHRRPAGPLRLRQHRDQGRARPVRHGGRAQAARRQRPDVLGRGHADARRAQPVRQGRAAARRLGAVRQGRA